MKYPIKEGDELIIIKTGPAEGFSDCVVGNSFEVKDICYYDSIFFGYDLYFLNEDFCAYEGLGHSGNLICEVFPKKLLTPLSKLMWGLENL